MTVGGKVDEGKKAVDAGISFAAAVKDKLGVSTEEFAKKHKLTRPEFSAMINGRRVPDDRQLDALIAELGGDRKGWLDFWFKVARRQAAGAV